VIGQLFLLCSESAGMLHSSIFLFVCLKVAWPVDRCPNVLCSDILFSYPFLESKPLWKSHLLDGSTAGGFLQSLRGQWDRFQTTEGLPARGSCCSCWRAAPPPPLLSTRVVRSFRADRGILRHVGQGVLLFPLDRPRSLVHSLCIQRLSPQTLQYPSSGDSEDPDFRD
jgi:hypothetical protein